MIETIKSAILPDKELVAKMVTYQIAGFIPTFVWVPFFNIKLNREMEAIKVQSLSHLSRLYTLPRNPLHLWKDLTVIWLNQPLFPLAIYTREKSLKQCLHPTLFDELRANILAGVVTGPIANALNVILIHKRFYREGLYQIVSRLWNITPKSFSLATNITIMRNITFVTNFTIVYPRTYHWLKENLNLVENKKELYCEGGGMVAAALMATILTNPLDNAAIRRQSTFHPSQAKSLFEALAKPYEQFGWRGPMVALVPRIFAATIEQFLIFNLCKKIESQINELSLTN